jgi:hypothetical protein
MLRLIGNVLHNTDKILIPVTPEIAGGTEGLDLVLYKVLAQVTLLTKTEWQTLLALNPGSPQKVQLLEGLQVTVHCPAAFFIVKGGCRTRCGEVVEALEQTDKKSEVSLHLQCQTMGGLEAEGDVGRIAR